MKKHTQLLSALALSVGLTLSAPFPAAASIPGQVPGQAALPSLAPMLEKVHATRKDVAVVAVDINRAGVKGIDWKSPVAKQYGLRSIPHFKVFGPDGKMIAEDKPDDAAARKMITQWFK